ncbi:MAG: T9SS type A sorting domain-containing protein, partial [Bacteroidales bacterium]|nr:T9SS type A sorting domain-containing protein [Bacteroidales bacterium]
VDNLVIAINEKSDNYDDYDDRFYCSAVTNNRSLVFYTDNENPDLSALPVSNESEMLIPNIRLLFGDPLAHDLAIIGISPNTVNTGSTVTPKVKIINYGLNNEDTWSITLTDGTSYNETLNNPITINNGETAEVNFPDWTPDDGTYILTASISLTDDEEASNDILTQNVIVAPIVIMSDGNTTTCYAIFTDSGGSDNDYQNNEDYTYTFYPGTTSDYIQVEFLRFNTEPNYDILDIYNGTISAANLIQSLTGNNIPSGPIKANNPDGALTFHFSTDGGVQKNGWQAIISCYTPPAHDLGVKLIAPTIIFRGDSPIPQVTIHNHGINLEDTYTVNLAIAGTTYSETVTGASISPGGDVVIDFPAWNAPLVGTYQMTATVNLSSDTDPTNNTKISEHQVIKFSYELGYNYGFSDNSGFIVRNQIETSELEDLAFTISDDFLACGEYINGVVYGVEIGTNNMYAINGDGAMYLTGKISGENSILGIAYDHINKDIYVSDCDYVENLSNLYILNPDFSTTLVGIIGSYYVTSIAADANGNLFGMDSDNYNFISINKTTGEGTTIGNFGISIGFGDIGGDKVNDVIYGTIYNDDTGEFGWYTIDKTTGLATLINNFDDEITMCAIVNEIVYSVTVIVTDGTNPIEGASVVCSDLSIDALTDVNGTVVFDAIVGTNYDLTVSATGYIDYTSAFDIIDQDITIPVVLGATNIDEFKTNISVVPNPTNGIINISADQNYLVQVLDLTGRIIESVNMNNNDISIDLTSKNSGMYIIRLTNENGTKTVKVIKR